MKDKPCTELPTAIAFCSKFAPGKGWHGFPQSKTTYTHYTCNRTIYISTYHTSSSTIYIYNYVQYNILCIYIVICYIHISYIIYNIYTYIYIHICMCVLHCLNLHLLRKISSIRPIGGPHSGRLGPSAVLDRFIRVLIFTWTKVGEARKRTHQQKTGKIPNEFQL